MGTPLLVAQGTELGVSTALGDADTMRQGRCFAQSAVR